MKSNWVGNRRLQACVKAGAARVITEVLELQDSHVKDVKTDWMGGSVSGGDPLYLNSGGVTMLGSVAALIPKVENNNATLNNLTHVPTFNAVLVTWLLAGAEEIEIHNLVARLDPRRDGGQPKTVSLWEAQLFRITRILVGGEEEGGVTISPISRPVRVDATGEGPADFTFNFEALGGSAYPRVGLPPTAGGVSTHQPKTLARIIGLQADGSPATNVAWMANSGQSSEVVAAYRSESVTVMRPPVAVANENGGSAYRIEAGADYPEFTLNQVEYGAPLTIAYAPGTAAELVPNQRS